MSWSCGRIVTSAEELEGLHPPGERLTDEAEEQIGVAVEAAKTIIRSGAVGTGKKLSVSISGHANPNHEPLERYANDAITVSIYQQAS